MAAPLEKEKVILIFRVFFLFVLGLGTRFAQSETRVVVDYSKKYAQGLIRSRGPIPSVESDFDGYKLFNGMNIPSRISGGSQIRSFTSSDGIFSVECTVITSLRHGICHLNLKGGLGTTFDKEIDGALWRPVGKVAEEVKKVFLTGAQKGDFLFLDTSQIVSIYSSPSEFVLKLKSK